MERTPAQLRLDSIFSMTGGPIHKDYGQWSFVARVDAIKAGTKPGDPGYAEGGNLAFGVVYVLDKGASAPEPASLSLILAGALAVLLSRAISAVRSSGEKSATKIARSPV